jgi:hypothetical protein
MESPTARLRLRIELNPGHRLVPRILTLVSGRRYVLERIEYEGEGGSSSQLLLEASGPEHLSQTVIDRLRGTVGVREVYVVPALDTTGVAAPVAPSFRVERVRASVRLDGESLMSDVSLALRTHDDRSILAAGEGHGVLDAMAEAFRQGLQTAFARTSPTLEVCRASIRVERPNDGLSSEVSVDLEARVGPHLCFSTATGTEIVSAGLRAFCALYHGELVEAPAGVAHDTATGT